MKSISMEELRKDWLESHERDSMEENWSEQKKEHNLKLLAELEEMVRKSPYQDCLFRIETSSEDHNE